MIYFALNFNRRDNLECFMGESGPVQERLCKGDYLLKMGKEIGDCKERRRTQTTAIGGKEAIQM